MSNIQYYNQIDIFNRYSPLRLDSRSPFSFFQCIEAKIQTPRISNVDLDMNFNLILTADLYNAKHPLILCTDDFGVFSTSLSNEYALAVRSFGKFPQPELKSYNYRAFLILYTIV